VVESVVNRLGPGLKVHDCVVYASRHPTSLQLSGDDPLTRKPTVGLQLFAISESDTLRSAVVFDGRVRYARLHPAVPARMRRERERRESLREQTGRASAKVKPGFLLFDNADDESIDALLSPGDAAVEEGRALLMRDESAFQVRVREFIRLDPGTETGRPMKIEDFLDSLYIEEVPAHFLVGS
jgi:hypothetical protein